MNSSRRILAIAAASLAMGAALATTLAPTTLDEQIAGAELIFRGRAVESRAVEEPAGGGKRIVTIVRFVPLAIYKGDATSSLELTFLGGRVGDTEMRVDGMPQFEMGREYVLFVSPDRNLACPVVGWTQGTLPVDPATGEVRLSESVAAGLRSARAASPSALSARDQRVGDFEAALRERIREAGRQ